MKFIKKLLVVALMTGGLHLYAQQFGIEYTTELQTNFDAVNFVNLLRLNAEVPISKSVAVEASTISIAKTRDERLADDLQTFSNIEEDNLSLAIAVCGANWQIADKHSLFMGIRNMNEDYFTSPVTSFFTNSSCGIYPTISANYPIANYPVASVGVHYRYYHTLKEGAGIGLQASIYNGTGYNRFTGRDNVFRVCPKADGVYGMAEVSYSPNGNYYSLGNALYYNRNISATPWFYTEQKISQKFTLLVSYSHAFTAVSKCEDFIGLGVLCHFGKCQLGACTNYAKFVEKNEFAAELTFKIPFIQHMNIQPIAHIISFDKSLHCITMIRMSILL